MCQIDFFTAIYDNINLYFCSVFRGIYYIQMNKPNRMTYERMMYNT